MTKLAVIGAGVMGETVLSGLLHTGWAAEDIVVTARRPERRKQLVERYGVGTTDNVQAAADARIVLIAVKPQDLITVLDEIAPAITPQTTVASLAAGVATDVIEAHLPAGTPVVRVMPNTPAQVAEGIAAVSAGQHAAPDQVGQVAELLAATGQVTILPEKYQDAVTAISGSGPAYVFFIVESMIEAGVHLGLPRHIAAELVVQTVYGSAKLLKETGDHPTVLRERVTSPGGTTAAAIRVLEDHKVRAAFLGAAEAARNRGAELAAAARKSATRDPEARDS
ncbi:pyrroline-5-carboxylate reductase [Microlunatus sp. Gsoil 973]|uniref:pyrroline-5-carboxylate reductase n=1 Tax=Microlunatus sp. Gsoil 973 TaxID=2672569 RepID=UPI0012B4D653|nr:pyrroline-5-carboxylate reductase [Microlunatus sp. Gsoil 973]QGN33833.1 pyrroline-5-carboxylate reductase [Microlunatus sp. Gsoil 973]